MYQTWFHINITRTPIITFSPGIPCFLSLHSNTNAASHHLSTPWSPDKYALCVCLCVHLCISVKCIACVLDVSGNSLVGAVASDRSGRLKSNCYQFFSIFQWGIRWKRQAGWTGWDEKGVEQLSPLPQMLMQSQLTGGDGCHWVSVSKIEMSWLTWLCASKTHVLLSPLISELSSNFCIHIDLWRQTHTSTWG